MGLSPHAFHRQNNAALQSYRRVVVTSLLTLVLAAATSCSIASTELTSADLIETPTTAAGITPPELALVDSGQDSEAAGLSAAAVADAMAAAAAELLADSDNRSEAADGGDFTLSFDDDQPGTDETESSETTDDAAGGFSLPPLGSADENVEPTIEIDDVVDPDGPATPSGIIPAGFQSQTVDGHYRYGVPSSWIVITSTAEIEAIVLEAGFTSETAALFAEYFERDGGAIAIGPTGANINVLATPGTGLPEDGEQYLRLFEAQSGDAWGAEAEFWGRDGAYAGIEGPIVEGHYVEATIGELWLTQIMFTNGENTYIVSITTPSDDADLVADILNSFSS